jgi:hypothetical protein
MAYSEKRHSLMSLPDASSKVLRFVSDDVWGSSELMLWLDWVT